MSEGLVERLTARGARDWTVDSDLLREAAARILALEKEVAAAYSRGREAGAKVCTDWLDVFTGEKIKHTSAERYATDAVKDIRDQIRSLPDEAGR